MNRVAIVLATLSVLLAAGCGSKKTTGDADAGDAVDTADLTEISPDVPLDATPDAEPEAAPDAGPDAEPDATPDAGEDPAADGAMDATGDADDAIDDLGTEPPTCKTLVQGSYGMCDMVIGVGWTGTACEYFSGCSCSPDCAYFFPDIPTCQAACMAG